MNLFTQNPQKKKNQRQLFPIVRWINSVIHKCQWHVGHLECMCVCLCGQGTKGHTGASGLMGPPGPPGAQGRPGPPGPPSTGAQTDYCLRCNTVPYGDAAPCCLLSCTCCILQVFFQLGKRGTWAFQVHQVTANVIPRPLTVLPLEATHAGAPLKKSLQ